MSVYIASHSRELAGTAKKALVSSGVKVTSRWHDKAFHPTEHHTEQERREIAVEDVEDVCLAKALVLCAGPDRYSGGKFFEAGLAFGLNKPVYVWGRRENMLLWHPQVRAFNDLSDLTRYLEKHVR